MDTTRRFRPSGHGAWRAAAGVATALTERATHVTHDAGHPTEELVLGRYRLRRRLGTGGFASVWLARDERLERDVAVKLLARERIVGGRFEREAKATARLNHPGIVTLYEAAVDEEGAYLVSELVHGSTLGRLMHEGHLSDRDVGLAAIALCDALQYAHDQGVVHRDVKPSNILVPEHPHTTADFAKLTDFGVAHVIGGDSLTRTGDVIGTTAYMSPEQAEGRVVQSSADLYSLAVVIYEALTGINPLRMSDPGVRGGRLGARLPPLRRPRRDLPRELGCAVDLALRPRPRERGTLAELREALSVSIDELDDHPGVVCVPWPTVAGTDTPIPAPPSRWIERPPPKALAEGPSAPRPKQEQPRPRARPARHWPGRITGAAAMAVATAWFMATLLSSTFALSVLAMGAAAVLVALLPRLGWIALVAIGAVLLVLHHIPGAALLLVLASLPGTLLLARRPTRWPLAACVPALALAGLPGLWPALAGRTTTAWQRLILGGAGWLWLLVGEAVGGNGLYVTLPAQVQPGRPWTLYDTLHHVLHTLVFSGLLVPAVVWGLGAVLLPHTERPARRVAAVCVWSLVVVGLSAGLLGALRTGASLHAVPAILGALACAVLAALPQGALGPLRRQQAPTPPLDSRSMELR